MYNSMTRQIVDYLTSATPTLLGERCICNFQYCLPVLLFAPDISAGDDGSVDICGVVCGIHVRKSR